MKVALIQATIERFIPAFEQSFADEFLFLWESHQNFVQFWDDASTDPASMFDRAFQSNISNRLWSGSRHSPKSAMLASIQAFPDYAMSAFRDLFAESKDVVLRIQRFLDHCDEMTTQFNKKQPRVKLAHLHDHRMVSIYLAYRYPGQYCIYHYPAFKETMHQVGLANIPDAYDLERYFKLCRALNLQLNRSEALQVSLQKLANAYTLELPCNQLVTYAFLHLTAGLDLE